MNTICTLRIAMASLSFIFLLSQPIISQDTIPPGKWMTGLEPATTWSRIKSFPIDGADMPELPDDHQQLSLGFYISIRAGYRCTPRLLASAALAYHSQSVQYTLDETRFTADNEPDIPANAVINHSSYYLSVPVEIEYRLAQDRKNYPVIGIGGITSYYLGTKENYHVYADDGDAELTSGTIQGRSLLFENWNFHLRLSAAYHFPLNDRLDAGLRLAYNIALNQQLNDKALFNANHKVNYMMLGLQINYSM